MKDNHIPRKERLENRISKLYFKLYEYEPKKYGGGNPYSYCGACGKSMAQVSYEGHCKGCKLAGIENEIKFYKRLLRRNKYEICRAKNIFSWCYWNY